MRRAVWARHHPGWATPAWPVRRLQMGTPPLLLAGPPPPLLVRPPAQSRTGRTPATGASPLGVRRGEVRIPRHSSAVSNQVGTPGPLQAVAVGGPASTSAVPSTTVVVLPPPPLPPTTSTPPPTTAAAVLPSTTAALTVSTTAPLVAVAANVSPGTGVAGAGASTSVSPVTMTHPPLTVVPPTAPPVTVLEVTVPRQTCRRPKMSRKSSSPFHA